MLGSDALRIVDSGNILNIEIGKPIGNRLGIVCLAINELNVSFSFTYSLLNCR